MRNIVCDIFQAICFSHITSSLQVPDELLAEELQARILKKLEDMPTDMPREASTEHAESTKEHNEPMEHNKPMENNEPMEKAPTTEPIDKLENNEPMEEAPTTEPIDRLENNEPMEEAPTTEPIDKSWVSVKEEEDWEDDSWWCWDDYYDEDVEEEHAVEDEKVCDEVEFLLWKPPPQPAPKKMPQQPARPPVPAPAPVWQPPPPPPPVLPPPVQPPEPQAQGNWDSCPQGQGKAPWAYNPKYDRVIRYDKYGGVIYKSGWYQDSTKKWWKILSRLFRNVFFL